MYYKGVRVRETQQIENKLSWQRLFEFLCLIFWAEEKYKSTITRPAKSLKECSETGKITKHEVFKRSKLIKLEIMAAHSLGKILNRGLEKIIEGICNPQWLAWVSIAIDFISYTYIVPESW